jgi:phosphate uptake regulator
MGQRTLAFTKQMLRVFDLVELEEFDHLVAMLDRRFLEAQEQITIYSRREAKTNRHRQTNIYICIRTLHHIR